MDLYKAGLLSGLMFFLFISHGQKDGGLYSTECQGADGHEGRPHTLPLCVLLCFGVTRCERLGLEVEVTRDDRSCDRCFFVTTKKKMHLLVKNNNNGEDLILSARTHTLRWCVPGQVSAERSRLYPSSHHMDWNCSQEHRDGGTERGDRGMRTGGNHERSKEWWKGKGGQTEGLK